MDQSKMTETAFQIILYAGNGKSNAMEAIQVAKEGRFDEADKLLQAAGDELNNAHHYQTALLQDEAKGDKQDINLILVHSQDHLMNAMTTRDLAVEIIELYRMK